MTFPQLYTTTSYTLLHSTLRIPQFIQMAKERGYQILGITDHNVLSGTVEFYQACIAQQIRPVIGLELDYLMEGSDQENSILLYAKNASGYQNLIRLSSYNMTEPKALLLTEKREYLSDLYAVVPSGDTADHTDEEIQYFHRLRALFDAGSFFLGLSVEDLEESNEAHLSFLRQSQLPLLAAQSVCYLNPQDDFSVRVLKHINDGTTLEENLTTSFHDFRGEKYLRDAEDITALYEKMGFAEAIENAKRLAMDCQFELPLHQKLLPHFAVPEEETAGSYLQKLCIEALPQRVEQLDDRYRERLNYELKVIHEMGFDDYFLIVWDVMDFCHRTGIVTGAGRGSAAGSLVAYVLKITDVDPIRYELLFERFLNPERQTMPDIDLDIPDNRREEILKYVQKKYGRLHMAQIATFGTMAAKMVLRDVARVFGLSQSEANRWSQAVPNKLKITLEEAVNESNRLTTLAGQSEKYSLLLRTARQLEGLPRHVSTHAAGVVISDRDLLTLVPLQTGSEEILLTQFTMNDVEAIGLLKMDFLGLRNLSIIDDTVRGIKKVYHEDIQVKQVPLDDTATLKLFQRGETSGIFQFESAGIRNVLRRLEPNSIEDIAAVNALYRPGPMQNIDTFIRRKKGKEAITYPDESLKQVLGNTYGIIVYQEQVMQVASRLAGFSLGQADILRRAISKKKQAVLDEQRQLFVSGAAKLGHTQDKANEIYNYIERFGNYGFNRSHAFAYSFVGFQMAYLKVHFPAPFYTAILHSVRHNPSKIKEYVNEARKNKVKILSPSINQSDYSFKILDKETILFGFSALKGIRRDFIKEILDERRASGPYRSFDQFLIRVHNKWLKPENLIPLIAIGSFDEINPNRRELIVDLEGKIQNTVYSGGSMDLLDIMTLKERKIPEYTLEEKLAEEEKYLGVYLSGHPAEGFEHVRRAKKVQNIVDSLAGEKISILYYVKDVREIRTKRGEQMAFLEGDDASGEISVTLFPKLYRQVRSQMAVGSVFYVEGKIEESSFNGELQLLAETVIPAATLEGQLTGMKCFLKVAAEKNHPEILQELQQILHQFPGHSPVIVYFENDGRKIQLDSELWVSDSLALQQQLKQLLGNENVVFK